jgi:integrase
MSTTQPIRDKEILEIFKEYYHTQKPNPRNYALICVGLNTALRISDILSLRWKDVYDDGRNCFLTHVTITERKTQKRTRIALNHNVNSALWEYKQSRTGAFHATDYLFPGSNADTPLSRVQAFRLIKKIVKECHLDDAISCHSLRKTFGYSAWKQGTPPAMLMEIYNHSSYRITKRYLGITQDEKDDVFLHVNI